MKTPISDPQRARTTPYEDAETRAAPHEDPQNQGVGGPECGRKRTRGSLYYGDLSHESRESKPKSDVPNTPTVRRRVNRSRKNPALHSQLFLETHTGNGILFDKHDKERRRILVVIRRKAKLAKRPYTKGGRSEKRGLEPARAP